jgi:hypothetical protein
MLDFCGRLTHGAAFHLAPTRRCWRTANGRTGFVGEPFQKITGTRAGYCAVPGGKPTGGFPRGYGVNH